MTSDQVIIFAKAIEEQRVQKAMLSSVQKSKEFYMVKCAKQSSENVSCSQKHRPRPRGSVIQCGTNMTQGDAHPLERSLQCLDNRFTL